MVGAILETASIIATMTLDDPNQRNRAMLNNEIRFPESQVKR